MSVVNDACSAFPDPLPSLHLVLWSLTRRLSVVGEKIQEGPAALTTVVV